MSEPVFDHKLDEALKTATLDEQRDVVRAMARKLDMRLTEGPQATLDEAAEVIHEIHLSEEAAGRTCRPEQAREILRKRDPHLYERMIEASRAFTLGGR